MKTSLVFFLFDSFVLMAYLLLWVRHALRKAFDKNILGNSLRN